MTRMNDDAQIDKAAPLDEVPKRPFQFSLRLLLLLPVLVVLPIAMSHVFDTPVAGVWTVLVELAAGFFYRPTRMIAGIAFALALLVALLPMRSSLRAQARAAQCRNNLKQVVLALRLYHDRYGCFPPAYVADQEGRPMHSWRVLILPFLEQDALYRQYRMDEPWNGPNNRNLPPSAFHPYHCYSDPDANPLNTSYVLVTGEGTAWVADKAPKLANFTDGPSHSIAVVEVASSGIHWMEPRDLSLSQALRGINSPLGMSISSRHPVRGETDRPGGANVAFADGAVQYLKNDTPPAALRAMLTPAGGERTSP